MHSTEKAGIDSQTSDDFNANIVTSAFAGFHSDQTAVGNAVGKKSVTLLSVAALQDTSFLMLSLRENMIS